MNGYNRRSFLSTLLKGAGMTILGFVSGSAFSRKKLWAQETFQSVLQKATSRNVYSVLGSSRLGNEEKVAILTVREVGREEIQKTLSRWDGLSKSIIDQAGFFCGDDCDGGGFICGNNCHDNAVNSICAFDKSGRLGVSVKSLNKDSVKNLMQEAVNLAR